MRLHILGICGTFMSGIALLAKECGNEVSGSDTNIYPPMSTQLADCGIPLSDDLNSLPSIPENVDAFIVGNVMTRGNPIIEHILNNKLPYFSGPEWLALHVLPHQSVIAVAGTHGKTTTASLLAWILDQAGLNPGFLIGGIPENFGFSARLGGGSYFVIEADEYDSAFFDKRSKFLHYRPNIAILNNLEFDHADIFPNLAAIQQQFHYLVRTVPGNGTIIVPRQDANIQSVLERGCWSKVETFGDPTSDWYASAINSAGNAFEVNFKKERIASVNWELLGQHNINNALAAIAAANGAGVKLEESLKALSRFKNVKRRLEIKAQIKNITIYDDFAHHPTAIATTLAGLRAKIGKQNRIIVVLEFGSYTMRMGTHKDKIQEALATADVVICKEPTIDWGLKSLLLQFKQPTALFNEVNAIIDHLLSIVKSNDHIVVMSNSGFDNLHPKLLAALHQLSI